MTRIILLLFSSLPILIFGQIELQAPDFEPSKLIEKSGVGFYPIGRTVEVPEIENYLISEKKQELTIKVNGAKGLNLYFNELLLAPGEELHIYSEGKRLIYTSINTPIGPFGTDFLPGENITIAVKNCPISVLADIKDLGVFKEIPKEQTHYKSDPCQVDINCTEGNNWRSQQQGVMRILIRSNGALGWCTGSLINNTLQDCTPYILTAMHCAYYLNSISSSSDFSQYVFYFSYEKSGCKNQGFTATQVVSGCELISKSGEDLNTIGSDFMLLKLNQNLPSNLNSYFNGWDLSSTAPSQGVSIHHPSGDVKKISSFSNMAAHYSFQSPNTHWQLQWAPTANGHGVTESGSSGAPLFNENGLIVGTLTGGTSYCSTPFSPDVFGKFNYSWDLNSSDPLQQLMPYLDPTNSGVTSLEGKISSCSLLNTQEKNRSFQVFPNPTSGTLTVQGEGGFSVVGLYDIKGRSIKVDYNSVNNGVTVDLLDIPAGIYQLKVWDKLAFQYTYLKVIKQ